MTCIPRFAAAVPAANRDPSLPTPSRMVWAPETRRPPHGRVPRRGRTPGKQTDFYRTTQAKDGEVPLYSWIEWSGGVTCDAAARSMEADMTDIPTPEMPFDGKRMFWGGFTLVFDSKTL